MKKTILNFCLLIILPITLLAQNIKLASIFGDNMVLQQGINVPIWGKTQPNQSITIKIANKTVSTKADANGDWMVKTPVLKAGGPFEMQISSPNESIKLNSVMVGEVWLASGQSNMQFKFTQLNNPQKEISDANYENIRFYTVPTKISRVPNSTISASWKICNSNNAPDFSAVAYYFARDLHLEQKVPVGIISSAFGGTPAEGWISSESLANYPDFRDSVLRYKQLEEDWQTMYQDFVKSTRNMNPRPSAQIFTNKPTAQYNAMIAPLIPYGVKGFLWYQGENNANTGRSKQYQTLLPLLINDWRTKWNNEKLPFLIVQLPNFRNRNVQPVFKDEWTSLREAQSMALKLPKTGMAVTIDVGEADDIHPKNKLDVGKRLYLVARHVAYQLPGVYSGPVYRSYTVNQNEITISFDEIGGGLISKGDKVIGFSIAGSDKKFYWADAKIVGNKIIVSSEKVVNPVAVRYAWASNPECNLYNKEGLPASTFRTDDW